ncbi:hypothetical protein QEO74_gp10 [Arthrobacter phage Nandita]|uniref:Helix-turn-helix DNA binding domain protein n=1 Tax=Arthrobacter phage Nandita TaxID=2419963 RepID=A0A3G2KIH3_9CAUD|nr:hypothetical protein QEO74_gp10 [Arthrobacter phage Nandita]AYN58680.1 hypothetical protein PBI_NANDITA_61 [Arthrobacter phage Nandita]
MTRNRPEFARTATARKAVAAAKPRVLAAAKALSDAEHIPWDLMDPHQQYTFCADATAALAAADAVVFAPANIARVVRSTGLSIQSVNEVVRELRA